MFLLHLLRIVLLLFISFNCAYAKSQKEVSVYGVLADNPQFFSKTKDFNAQGNVTLLTSEGFLTADKLMTADGGYLLTLEGNVIVIRQNEVIKASRLIVDRRTSEMLFSNADVIADPVLNSQNMIDVELLGITPEELAFAVKLEAGLAGLKRELLLLRESFVKAKNLSNLKIDEGTNKVEDIKARYALILNRYLRTKYQGNLVFAELPIEAQKRFETRRSAVQEFFASHPDVKGKMQNVFQIPGYSRLKAEQFIKNKEGYYEFSGAVITPCRCSDSVNSLYSISARAGSLVPNEYAYLGGTTIDILNVPIIYSPWLVLPVKTRRESGFLRPYFYLSQQQRVMGIPFFLTLGDHADATIAANKFNDRGIRYDLESRLSVSSESNLRVYGEYIKDKKFLQDSTKYKEVIDKKIVEKKLAQAGGNFVNTTPDALANEISDLELQQQNPTNNRWYAQGSWNIPMTSWASLKVDAENSSDSSYLGDFGKDLSATTSSLDLLSPSQTAKRFLLQESAIEYYGKSIVLSGRLQGMQDLFFLSPSDTPVRLPRVEAFLLPKRYFDLPVAFSSFASWERVHRLGGSSFIDLPLAGTIKNNSKDADEPFVEGERLGSSTSLVLPLPANDYVNANFAFRLNYVDYKFPSISDTPTSTEKQTHLTYSIDTSTPLYSEFPIFSSKEKTLWGTLRHDFVPALQFKYIPEVSRSKKFPIERRLFYLEDSVVPVQEVYMGISSAWLLIGDGFADSGVMRSRIPTELDMGVANEQLLKGVIDSTHPETSVESKDELFELPASTMGYSAVNQWATQELEHYFIAVKQEELGQNFVWFEGSQYKKTEKWRMSPFSFSVSSSYNLRYKQTEEELNAKEGWVVGKPWINVEPWRDIVFGTALSAMPFLPFSARADAYWSKVWDRWIKTSTSISTTLPIGVSGAFTRTDTFTPTITTLTKETQTGYSLGYQPLPWLSFNHSWLRKNTTINGKSVQDASYFDSQYNHSDSQSISLINVQDCLDITIGRFKDFVKKEKEAIWSVSLNMNLFGSKTGNMDIGGPLNNKMQALAK